MFVVGVVALAFSQTAAIVAKFLFYYAIRLNGGPHSFPWTSYAPLMPIVISFVLLAAAFYVILARPYSSQDRSWAYGTLGTVLGFWLK